MSHYRIVEWNHYQHYKDRDPPWIKLHRDLLTSQTWVTLSDASRVLAIACMLIAAGTDNKIPTSAEYLKRRAYLNKEPDFKSLVEVGFVELVNDDNAVADASKMEQPQATDTECYSEESRDRDRDREEEEERAFGTFGLAAKRNGWPEPAKLSDGRRKKIRARLDEHGPDGWQNMLDLADASEFLKNKFKLSLDWVLEPRNFQKVIEGNYTGTQRAEPQKFGANASAPTRPSDGPPWEIILRTYKPGDYWSQMWGERPEDIPVGRVPTHIPPTVLAAWRATA